MADKLVKVGDFTSCNWCTQNEIDLQNSLKEMEKLQRRISELRQNIEACTHQQLKNNTNPVLPACNVSSSIVSSVEVMEIPLHFQNLSLEESRSADHYNKEEVKNLTLQQKTESVEHAHHAPQTATTVTTTDFTYKCIKEFNCSSSFPTYLQMLTHLEEKHGLRKENPPFCRRCGQFFSSPKRYHLHTKREHNFICETCNHKFKVQREYITHITNAHKPPSSPPEGKFKCSECDNELKDKEQLLQHLVFRHNGWSRARAGKQLVWIYDQCKFRRNFLSEDEYNSHIRINHSHECDVCGSTFSTFKARVAHSEVEHGHPPPAHLLRSLKNNKEVTNKVMK